MLLFNSQRIYIFEERGVALGHTLTITYRKLSFEAQRRYSQRHGHTMVVVAIHLGPLGLAADNAHNILVVVQLYIYTDFCILELLSMTI